MGKLVTLTKLLTLEQNLAGLLFLKEIGGEKKEQKRKRHMKRDQTQNLKEVTLITESLLKTPHCSYKLYVKMCVVIFPDSLSIIKNKHVSTSNDVQIQYTCNLI